MSFHPEIDHQPDSESFSAFLTEEQYKDERGSRLRPGLLEQGECYVVRMINESQENGFAADYFVRLGSMSGEEDDESLDLAVSLRSSDGEFSESPWPRVTRITSGGIVGPEGIEYGYFFIHMPDTDDGLEKLIAEELVPVRRPEQTQRILKSLHLPLPGRDEDESSVFPRVEPTPRRWDHW